jgi:predicted 3-demethylubiquinone-9 3-methyltransferase (glyoxalase superfamily)
MQKITPFLWFSDQAEEAANFYVSVFKNSKILSVNRYQGGKELEEISGRKEGSVMTVEFELDGQHFSALNGGEVFKFTEAISFVINCDTQEEVDHYWNKLTESGDAKAQQCGWLKDKYGVSWQVVPKALNELMSSKDPGVAQKVTHAMLQMKKLDIKALKDAAKK